MGGSKYYIFKPTKYDVSQTSTVELLGENN